MLYMLIYNTYYVIINVNSVCQTHTIPLKGTSKFIQRSENIGQGKHTFNKYCVIFIKGIQKTY